MGDLAEAVGLQAAERLLHLMEGVVRSHGQGTFVSFRSLADSSSTESDRFAVARSGVRRWIVTAKQHGIE